MAEASGLGAAPRRALLAAMVLVAIAHAPELAAPPMVDQANFELAARELAGDRCLYRDLLDVKPPLIFWTYMAVRAALGASHQAVVVTDALIVMVTLCLTAWALGGRWGDRALAMGLLLWGLAAGVVEFAGNLAILQPETLENLLVAIVLALGARRRLSPHRIALLVAIAALAKGIPALVVLLVALSMVEGSERVRLAAVSVAGACGLVVAWLLWVFAHGAFDGLREALGLALHQPEAWRVPALGYAKDLCALVPLALAGLLASLRDPAARPLHVWLGLAAVQIAVQGRYFGYHFAALLPPAALLAGLALDAAMRHRPTAGRWTAVAALVIQLALAVDSQITFNTPPIAFCLGQISREQLDNQVRPTWGLTALEIRAAAATVRSLTDPHDAMFVLGIVPQLFLWSERPFFGRYLFHYFLLVDCPLSAGDSARKRRQAEFMEAFQRAPPAAVAIPRAQSDVPGLFQNSLELASFPALADALDRDYELHPVGPIALYMRRARSPDAGDRTAH